MEFIKIYVICDKCRELNVKDTTYIPGYDGSVTKSFWCEHCGEPQVIVFKFIGKEAEVIERIEPSSVYVPRKPDIGITIRPRAKN